MVARCWCSSNLNPPWSRRRTSTRASLCPLCWSPQSEASTRLWDRCLPLCCSRWVCKEARKRRKTNKNANWQYDFLSVGFCLQMLSYIYFKMFDTFFYSIGPIFLWWLPLGKKAKPFQSLTFLIYVLMLSILGVLGIRLTNMPRQLQSCASFYCAGWALEFRVGP